LPATAASIWSQSPHDSPCRSIARCSLPPRIRHSAHGIAWPFSLLRAVSVISSSLAATLRRRRKARKIAEPEHQERIRNLLLERMVLPHQRCGRGSVDGQLISGRQVSGSGVHRKPLLSTTGRATASPFLKCDVNCEVGLNRLIIQVRRGILPSSNASNAAIAKFTVRSGEDYQVVHRAIRHNDHRKSDRTFDSGFALGFAVNRNDLLPDLSRPHLRGVGNRTRRRTASLRAVPAPAVPISDGTVFSITTLTLCGSSPCKWHNPNAGRKPSDSTLNR